jgi:hypothetical protein
MNAADTRNAVEDSFNLREKVRWVLDRICWCRDVITFIAKFFGAMLFVLAGCYGGYSLIYAMQGMFGTLGCILAVVGSGGAVAVTAYLDSVDETESANIEDEVEAEYNMLKAEERSLIKDLHSQAEDREIEHQLRTRSLIEEALRERSLMEEALRERGFELELDREKDKADEAPQTSSIERLRHLRDRLEKLGAHSHDVVAAEEPAPEVEAEADKVPMAEPAEEPPPEESWESVIGSAEVSTELDGTADVLRRATLRHRAKAVTASSSGDTGNVEMAEEEK